MVITERSALFEGVFGYLIYLWIQLVLSALQSFASQAGFQLGHLGDVFLSHMSYWLHQCFDGLEPEIVVLKATHLLPVVVGILINTREGLFHCSNRDSNLIEKLYFHVPGENHR